MSISKEIEIKYTVEDTESLIKKLNKCAVYKGEYRQSDTYYNPPHIDFLENPKNISKWLRLRHQNGNSSINFKSFYFPKTHCDEYETQVASVETLQSILKALDFKTLITVDKIRHSWDFKDIEISIDTIEGLGTYIELEYKGSREDINGVLIYLKQTLSDLTDKLGEPVIYGYPHLMMLKNGWFK